MPEQQRVQPSTTERTDAPKPSDVKQSERSAKVREGLADLDDLFDEIDEMLDEQTVEALASYRQAGGE